LGWTHYRLLLSVTDKNKRISFQSQALKHNWNAEELQEAIKLERLKDLEVEDVKAPALSGQSSFITPFQICPAGQIWAGYTTG